MRAQHVLTFLALGFAGIGAGCAPLAIGAVATTGMAVAQERSVGNTIDDFSVQTNISTRLHEDHPTAYEQMDVEVVEGRVLLTGRVAYQDDRIEAVRIVWSTPGVAEVINEVEVNEQRLAFIRPRDVWIETQLRARLMGDEDIHQLNYHIEMMNGTVYLFGIAQDDAELERATAHARNIRGVQNVISYMRFVSDPVPSRSQGA